MAAKFMLLLLATLMVAQAYGRLIRPRIPIIRPRSTSTAYPTPSMVDLQTWNFTKPSDFARNCLNNQLGKTIVDFCQQKALADWDPVKMNTTKTTTWEMCCSVYEETDCYQNNAANFCPSAMAKAVTAYSRKVGFFFQYSICRSVPYYGWKRACDNETHAQDVKHHKDNQDNNPDIKPGFIHLPLATGPEKYCFRKLRANYTMINKKRVNQEQQCLNQALDVWDPSRRKLKESAVLESCCAIFKTLDCVRDRSRSFCSTSESNDLETYRKQSMVALSATICKAVPADQAERLCKSGSYANLPSLLTMMVTLFAFVRFNY